MRRSSAVSSAWVIGCPRRPSYGNGSGVSTATVRGAFDQLRAEGLVVSQGQGAGSFVREQTVPRRLSTDITTSLGWYHTLARQGLTPKGQTTVRTEPARLMPPNGWGSILRDARDGS